jgi:AcrR family transcriptional regulator
MNSVYFVNLIHRVIDSDFRNAYAAQWMGISERKKRQKAELRETILAAARRIFAKEGADGMTMRRIAEAIEYSPGTIYLYFANREEIALVLVREGFEKLLAAFAPALGIVDPVARLRALGQAYIAFGLTDPQAYKLIFMVDAKFVSSVLEPARGEPADDPAQRAFAVLAGTIAEAVAGGAFRAIDPARAAEALWSALHGVLSLAIVCPNALTDARAVGDVVRETMLTGFRA